MENCGFIDSHAHFFPEEIFRSIWKWFDAYAWKVRYQLPTDRLVRILKEHGAERFVCYNYAHKAGMSRLLNQWTAGFSERYPEVIPFAAIHPEDEELAAELKRCFSTGFKGVKVHCHVTGIPPDDERMFPIYEAVVEGNRVLVIHGSTGPDLRGYAKQIAAISGTQRLERMLKRFPEMKCIVPHFGVEQYEEFFALMDKYENLYTDNAMVLSNFFPNKPDMDFLLDCIVKHQDRVLYGSDFPNIPYELEREIEIIKGLPLPQEVKNKLFVSNAVRLFGL
jgi:hypothetical protein